MWTACASRRLALAAPVLAALVLAACAGPAQRAPQTPAAVGSGPGGAEPAAPLAEVPDAPALDGPLQASPAAAPVAVPPVPEGPDLPIDASVRRDFQQAVASLREGRYEPAIELLESLHRRRPRLSEPLLNLGIAQARSNRLEAAEVALRQALQLRETATGWNQLGLVLRRRGSFAAARRAYERALELEPNHAYARLNLGVVCELYLGDLGCALAQYQAYLETQPEEAEQVRLWIFDLQSRIERQ